MGFWSGLRSLFDLRSSELDNRDKRIIAKSFHQNGRYAISSLHMMLSACRGRAALVTKTASTYALLSRIAGVFK